MRKELKSNDKSHGPIKSNESLSKEREKRKIQLEAIKKHGPKKIKMKAPKMKWAKFKRLTQIEDLVKHERQPKCF